MCLNPQYIKLNRNGISSRLRSSNPLIDDLFSQPLEVPCRNCVECTVQRQKDYTQYLTEVMKNCGGSVAFRTLTYRQDMLPLAVSFSKPTAEEYPDFDYRPNILKRNQLEQIPAFHKNRPHKQKFSTSSGKDVWLTPSLRRKDVSDCLKVARQRYFRKYNKRAEFKFFLVGEYGSKSARPHYHIIFFNVDKQFLEIFESLWQELYGFTFSSLMQMRNDGFVQGDCWAVASYVAKYVTKGVFEISWINAVEKPRIVSSCGLLRFTPEQIEKFRGYDWLKEHGLFGKDFSLWTEEECNDYFDLVSQRCSFTSQDPITGAKETFPFSSHLRRLVWIDSFKVEKPCEVSIYCPDFIKNRLFKTTDYVDKVGYVYLKNELSFLCSFIARKRNNDNLLFECPSVEGESFDALDCEQKNCVLDFHQRKALRNKTFVEKSLFDFYSISAF